MEDFEEYKKRAELNHDLRRQSQEDSLGDWKTKHEITHAEQEQRDQEKAQVHFDTAQLRADSNERIALEKLRNSQLLANMSEEAKLEFLKLEHELEPEKLERAINHRAQEATIEVQQHQMITQNQLIADLYRMIAGALLGMNSNTTPIQTQGDIDLMHANTKRKLILKPKENEKP